MNRLGALLWLAVCCGCGKSDAPQQPAPSPPPSAAAAEGVGVPVAVEAPAASTSAAAIQRESDGGAVVAPPSSTVQLLRVAKRSGSQGDVLLPGLGRRLWTGKDGSLAFDLPGGARVELQPDSDVLVPAFAASSVLLGSGAAYVALAPSGNQPGRTAVRAVVTQATLRVPVAGEAYLAQRRCVSAGSSGPTPLQALLVQLQGGAELLRFGADLVLSEPLQAGQGFASGLRKPPAFAAMTKLADARKLSATALQRCQQPEPVRDSDQRLDQALLQLRAAAAESRSVLKRVAAAVLKQGSLRAAAVDAGPTLAHDRHALVAEAQHKNQLRQVLLLAAEQSLLAALVVCPDAVQRCESLERWQASYLAQLTAAL